MKNYKNNHKRNRYRNNGDRNFQRNGNGTCFTIHYFF